MAQDYNKTLNLPNTKFPMRGGLPTAEPIMLEEWEQDSLYHKMVENTKDYPKYIFHDGPPYANASIHLGTALNKVLKDFIVRHKNMSGRHTAYIPGWDTHGLPIELKAIEEYGKDIVKDPVLLRERCHDFALHHVEAQKVQFKRLGTLANYDDPYLTLKPSYEAKQIEVFGAIAENGYVYKDLKPGIWCADCVTALAEAEIEYSDDNVDSLYVKFTIVEDKNGVLKRMGSTDLSKTSVLIWTTTTWTLPANQAISLNPKFDYVLVKVEEEFYLLAKELVESTMKTAGLKEDDYEVLGLAKGDELEYIMYQHPFLNRQSPLILGDHVTLEAGTGAVHTAPGHGEDDFNAFIAYKEFFKDTDILVPVNEVGRMNNEAGDFIEGVTTYKANKLILERLKEDNNLFSIEKIVHQYPHCWRCKKPIIYRATEQWFISIEGFKAQVLSEIEKVDFIPAWGKARMHGMVADRGGWTISRQRAWGVPIPIFYCKKCEEPVINKETIAFVVDLFGKEGSDSWFIKAEKDLLPVGFTCPHCGDSAEFRKETDTMDVWFDAGCSHAAVMDVREDGGTPIDLYLEGGDQYRGWFQSSLLTSVASKGKAPYRTVTTHGMVVDHQGRKMSKSIGNGIEPEEVYNKYGADILRLWVASSDYHTDIRVSDKILNQLSEAYRKIRNTARYMLGNLSDFNPNTDAVETDQLHELDRWALSRFYELVDKCTDAYEKFEFHVVYHNLLGFYTTEMSNFYLDIIKDRLYIERTEGPARRAAQTVMYKILHGMTLLMAPVLCFTSEEIWKYIPHLSGDNVDYAVLNQMPVAGEKEDQSFMNRWEKLGELRDRVNKSLELARSEQGLGKSLEAQVYLYLDQESLQELEGEEKLLETIFIVSKVTLAPLTNQPLFEDTENLSIKVAPADGDKCERCWTISTTVGESSKHSTLCSRCAEIVG